MSIVNSFKQYLPGSSRSLHAVHRDVTAMHDEAHLQLAEIRCALDLLTCRVDGLNRKCDQLGSELEAHDAHMKLFAWENYCKEGESIDDAKKRFYRSLPKATGGMRLFQLGCAKLMGEFDVLCRENGLQYRASYDAIRRCSPWRSD